MSFTVLAVVKDHMFNIASDLYHITCNQFSSAVSWVHCTILLFYKLQFDLLCRRGQLWCQVAFTLPKVAICFTMPKVAFTSPKWLLQCSKGAFTSPKRLLQCSKGAFTSQSDFYMLKRSVYDAKNSILLFYWCQK